MDCPKLKKPACRHARHAGEGVEPASREALTGPANQL
jgi:hypothetical protein